jgi:hypothetical protein
MLHKARFQNCHFEEKSCPSLTSPDPCQPLVFVAPQTITMNPEPKTILAESEIRKLLALQALVEKLPEGFNDSSRITRIPLLGAGKKKLKFFSNQDAPQSLLPKPKKPRSNHHGELIVYAPRVI